MDIKRFEEAVALFVSSVKKLVEDGHVTSGEVREVKNAPYLWSDCEHYVYPSLKEAHDVIEQMVTKYEKDGFVTLGDWYMITCARPAPFSKDRDWGWEIKRLPLLEKVEGGYCVYWPEPKNPLTSTSAEKVTVPNEPFICTVEDADVAEFVVGRMTSLLQGRGFATLDDLTWFCKYAVDLREYRLKYGIEIMRGAVSDMDRNKLPPVTSCQLGWYQPISIELKRMVNLKENRDDIALSFPTPVRLY